MLCYHTHGLTFLFFKENVSFNAAYVYFILCQSIKADGMYITETSKSNCKIIMNNKHSDDLVHVKLITLLYPHFDTYLRPFLSHNRFFILAIFTPFLRFCLLTNHLIFFRHRFMSLTYSIFILIFEETKKKVNA